MNKIASRVCIEPESSTFFWIIFGLAIFIGAIKFGESSLSEGNAFWGLIVMLIGICVGSYVIKKAIQRRLAIMRKFEKGSTTTTAWVINQYVETFSDGYSGGDTNTYYVVIKFTAVEKEWTLEAMVDKKLYDRTKKLYGRLYGRTDEEKLSVIYADSDPRCVILEGEPEFERFV